MKKHVIGVLITLLLWIVAALLVVRANIVLHEKHCENANCEVIMYLYNIRYVLTNPRGNRKTNTVYKRGRTKREAIRRFRKNHPKEEILSAKQVGVLMIYTGDSFD